MSDQTPASQEENQQLKALMNDRLWLKVIIGLVLGLMVGALMGPDLGLIGRDSAAAIGGWLALPGNLFLTMIRFVVVPLVIASVALGIAGGEDSQAVKKVGISVLLYFVFTTTVAVSMGIFITSLINPGGYMDQGIIAETMGTATMNVGQNLGLVDAPMPEVIVGLFPTNPMASMASGAMLEIVIAAIIFGVALLMIPKHEAKPLKDVLVSVQSTTMAIVTWLMRFAPIAVFGLLANVMIKVGFSVFAGLTAYIITFFAVMLAIFIFYMFLVYFVAGRNPIDFIRNAREPMVISFSTSSSSATMPVTLKTTEEKLKVNPTVGRLVIPVGATINMDGTAAYQAVVVLFLAQVFGIDLGLPEIAVLLAISIGASIGTPGVPGGALGILLTILISVGIPPEGLAIVLSVDRILDMFRTSLNCTGDMVTATVMERILGLKRTPEQAAEAAKETPLV